MSTSPSHESGSDSDWIPIPHQSNPKINSKDLKISSGRAPRKLPDKGWSLVDRSNAIQGRTEEDVETDTDDTKVKSAATIQSFLDTKGKSTDITRLNPTKTLIDEFAALKAEFKALKSTVAGLQEHIGDLKEYSDAMEVVLAGQGIVVGGKKSVTSRPGARGVARGKR